VDEALRSYDVVTLEPCDRHDPCAHVTMMCHMCGKSAHILDTGSRRRWKESHLARHGFIQDKEENA